ncbi:hypothetical protein [Idiomarina abyssalis]|uniref:hypothetical protein n=1 Tax=Idiomarina abyssalis TaxID=86102 RepID=UPI003A8FBAF3
MRKDTCYFCGAEKTSMEHVPPKSFFPKELRQDLIRVPSCDKHNSKKSNLDEYFRTVFFGVSSSAIKNTKLRSVNKKIITSLSRNNGSNFFKVFNRKNMPLNEGVDMDRSKLDDFMISISRGIYFYEYEEIFNGKVEVIPFFIDDRDYPEEYKEIKDISIKVMKKEESYSRKKNKEVFFYSIQKSSRGYIFDFTFYNDIHITAVLIAEEL